MPKSYGPKPTAQNTRDKAGVGSVINTHHEGPTKRPTENVSGRRLDNLTAADIAKKSETKETPMNNPGFGSVGEKKG